MSTQPVPPTTITCVDCGFEAHLLNDPEHAELVEDGVVLVYRCSGCLDRWDMVWSAPEVS